MLFFVLLLNKSFSELKFQAALREGSLKTNPIKSQLGIAGTNFS